MANPSLVPDLVRHRLIIDHRDIVVLFLCLYSELFGKIPGHYYVALILGGVFWGIFGIQEYFVPQKSIFDLFGKILPARMVTVKIIILGI